MSQSRPDTYVEERLHIVSGTYHARQIELGESGLMAACHRLRHLYFAEARNWVLPDQTSQIEADHYDVHALHLAVLKGESVVAYFRLLPFGPNVAFMLDHEFRCLWGGQELEREDAAEISRLVVSNSLEASDKQHVIELLFKLFYQTALHRHFQHFYIVVESCWLRLCQSRFGFRFTPIGRAYTFPDGTRTVAAYASLSDLERSMQEYSMEKFRWYADLDPISRR